MALNPADIAVVSQLLDQVLVLPLEAREAWLAALPPEHQRHAEALRGMLAQEAGLDNDPRLVSLPKLASDEAVARADDRVGPYRLLREIGRGGMGSVWLAERADGAYKRQVALKLPRLAWGAGLAERMAREREIGMLLEHPNIARLYDAGVDERGRPFLALEYVDGQPIDAWCEAQGLSVRERLRLFMQVAKAVAYAHGRLVVHRDLKPSNVLVTPDGQAHLLDFGIAKLLGEMAPGEAGLTQQQGRVMTPHYASPEQVAGEAITVQSDVYSLGVLLYELLTGVLPIAPKRATLGAVEEAILEGAAPLASSRVRDKATARALRGEVDAILAKAMQREPGRRYATADALAQDIERHLNGETVSARPDSLRYRMRKAVRRHWVGVLAGTAVLVAVISGSGVAVMQAQRAAQQSERARLATEFVSEMFRANSALPRTFDHAKWPINETMLDYGARLIQSRFAGQPQMQADLYGVVGRIYADIGANKLAADYAKRQIELLGQVSDSRPLRVQALLLLADASFKDDLNKEAEEHAAQAFALAGSDATLSVQALALLSRIQIENGNLEEGRSSLRLARRLSHAIGPSTSPAGARLLESEAILLTIENKFDQAVPVFKLAVDSALNAEGALSRTAIGVRIYFAHALQNRGRFHEARLEFEAGRSNLVSSGPEGEIQAAMEDARFWTKMLLNRGASYMETVAVIEQSRSFLSTIPTPIPAVVRASIDFDLARAHLEGGNVSAAKRLGFPSIEILKASTSSLQRIRAVAGEARLAMTLGRHDLADRLFREVLELNRARGTGQHPSSAWDWVQVALNLTMAKRYDEAEAFLADAPLFDIEGERSGRRGDWPTLVPRMRALLHMERAEPRVAQALLPALRSKESDVFALFGERALYGQVLCAAGSASEGLPLLLESIRSIERFVGEGEPSVARLRAAAGICSLAFGDRAHALELAALARHAFAVQPGVSPYFKAPLFKLESALGLKLPPV